MTPGSFPPERTLPGSTVTSRLTFRLASVALILMGLIWARGLLVPIVLAVMLAVLAHPLVELFERRRMPYPAAVALGQLLTTIPLLGISLLFILSAQPFLTGFERYQSGLEVRIAAALEWLVSHVAEGERRVALEASLRSEVIPRALEFGGEIVKGFAQSVSALVGGLLLTLVVAFFALLEAGRLREKFSQAFGEDNALFASLEAIQRDIRGYVVAKTLTSLLTSFCVWIVLAALQVPYATLWAVLAFPMNFVPTVGATIASVPPMLMAAVDPQTSTFGLSMVCLGLVLVNVSIGTLIEPRYLGRKLALSPLVVFLSMLLWYLIWGPIGAVLAVPIMVTVKVICSHVRGLERVAIILQA